MTPEFAYFLKVNVAFILLYAFYRLFFYKDTFFKLRRTILLAFFGVSLLYPLMNIQDWVREQEPMVEVIQMYSAILPETTITPDNVPETNWHDLLLSGVSYLYWGGVIALLLRFLVQLSSILLLARRSEVALIRNVRVHLLSKPAGPFSFFRLVFLHPDSHSEKEIDEILTHECTHVNQWHSIDVIICELVCIICWVNPFVWLLKREVRHNLEYLADDTVLESGYDSRSYQYHLLGLAHTNRSATSLSNNFNMLHLKNRISMMNKKRSRSIGKTKYLIFIPVVGVLLILSNVDASARITDELAESTFADVLLPEAILPFPFAGDASPAEKREEYVLSEEGIEAVKRARNQIFTVVEVMPEFPGGQGALLKFLATNVRYPESAVKNGIEGRVSCSFVAGKDGAISEAEVIRGVSPELNEEALRVINSMPVWSPGKQRGEAVNVKYTVPVTFRLSGGKKKTSSRIAQRLIKEVDTSGRVFTVVQHMPEFPGGQTSLLKYLATRIKYPTIAQENGIQGRVSCSFVVDTDGSLKDIEVIRGIDPSLDREAVRVIREMPKWNPGVQNNMAVAVKYTVPVTFRLQ
ncbi:M56 family metallopeptidase [Parabacteroides johnsonii]|uniref:M56 family metallopeptidase n=1 Tax=Parabacteroides johnsonii TaxID=387661 RepID=UPI00242BA50D|nr:M56 family metallopeptidase [Parabacteroides johnsonii]MBS6223781.1 M56 family metallopeptidase [Parabacteroides johnsonii]